MTLTEQDLVIHVGDRASFYVPTQDSDSELLEGEVMGVVPSNELMLRINTSELAAYDVEAKYIVRVNNLFINLNNFSNNINLSVAV